MRRIWNMVTVNRHLVQTLANLKISLPRFPLGKAENISCWKLLKRGLLMTIYSNDSLCTMSGTFEDYFAIFPKSVKAIKYAFIWVCIWNHRVLVMISISEYIFLTYIHHSLYHGKLQQKYLVKGQGNSLILFHDRVMQHTHPTLVNTIRNWHVVWMSKQ